MIDSLRWQARDQHFVPWLLLMVLGWVMVASASTGIGEKLTGNAAYFAIRHGVYLILGVVALYGASQISLARWRQFELPMLAVGFAGLCLVLVPGVGHEVNGSRRWLNFVLFKLQASELAKLAAVFYVAGYLVRRLPEVRERFWGFIKPLIVLVIMVLLLLMEPDFGAAVVLLGATMIQLFLGGVKAGQYFLLMIGTGALSVVALTSEEWRVARLMAYLDPWAPEHVYGTGYQLTQSLIAFGRGEWFGVGLGESVQKLFYLPEAHTDFVFAIWAEETGLFGGLMAIGLLTFLVVRIWQTVWIAQQRGLLYGAYIAAGIGSMLALQIVINLGVNIGLLPTKGLTLPFFSYGGSSLILACAMVGIVMRIKHEAMLMPEPEPRDNGGRA
ncbi:MULTISPECIES: putative lipid II flippase FtsW [unclassified Oceanobacter]|jgi:cell division protein FtsW|nr:MULTISPECIES: putative lipid II flippase FtsW [unclassified Oceanobacter]MDO6682265.1 putative lipid II flippase FtsW [Oceanobacter sp. 5_MG-2023]MDP2506302.1 putative lipid II flippase FtsW [Oceanobacter sp. 3_MG-2023]MDP2546437.1 putative lipid II flippase FtsW [Oceanobacter sp. 4_MG-2023]MDP2609962.1 putative lipid II flippase FtsW [Oceanobacter sp. 1_MG-2023]MDP2613232.1 putative lipid II flippase FtsW [Oceanobacter sp. 2_MG-2023]